MCEIAFGTGSNGVKGKFPPTSHLTFIGRGKLQSCAFFSRAHFRLSAEVDGFFLLIGALAALSINHRRLRWNCQRWHLFDVFDWEMGFGTFHEFNRAFSAAKCGQKKVKQRKTIDCLFTFYLWPIYIVLLGILPVAWPSSDRRGAP